MSAMPAVWSVMTACPHVVDLRESLLRARVMMVEHDIRHLPVQRDGVLVGVLTDRDLKRALDPDVGLPPKEELLVEDVFVPEAYTVDASEPLDRVLEEMAETRIGSALVTRDDRLVGILTATDACRILCDHLRRLHGPPAGDDPA